MRLLTDVGNCNTSVVQPAEGTELPLAIVDGSSEAEQNTPKSRSVAVVVTLPEFQGLALSWAEAGVPSDVVPMFVAPYSMANTMPLLSRLRLPIVIVSDVASVVPRELHQSVTTSSMVSPCDPNECQVLPWLSDTATSALEKLTLILPIASMAMSP